MKILSRITTALLGAAVAVIVFELLLRAAGFMPEYHLQIKTLNNDAGRLHIILDSKLLYRVKPNSQHGINNLGYRDRFFPAKKTSARRVLVLGDSFIMSNNLSPEETVPKLVESKLGGRVEVFNLGVSGYGPDQSFLALLDHGLALAPDLVVLSIFAGNDFRDIDLNGLFEVNPHGQLTPTASHLVKKALPPTRIQLLLNMVFKKRYLPQLLEDQIAAAIVQDKTEIMEDVTSPKNRRRRDLMFGLLRLFKTTLEQNQTPFMVMVLPSYESLSRKDEPQSMRFFNERLAVSLCRRLKIPVVDLTPPILAAGGTALFDAVYLHPNSQGTQIIAAVLADALQKHFSSLFEKK